MLKAQIPRSVLAEFAIVVALICCVAAPFWKTVLTGAPISKLSMLKPMDAVQDPTLCAPWCILDDLSSSMSHIPNEFFAEQSGNSADFPLWNPLNGGGRPFLGEFQTLEFSFFHKYFPAASSYAYNLGLVLKILLSAAGAYLLARSMQVSRWSSLAAAAAYALCPHCLRFTELVDNFCFYPWLSIAFLWFAKRPSLLRAIACGLLTAACAYNMHPETFACAAGLSAAFALISLSGDGSRRLRPGKAFLWILLIAAIAFCAAAPLVLPLVEFIANGSSYKYAAHQQIEHIQFIDFICDLFIPGRTGSSYMGVVLGLSLPLGLLVCSKRNPLLVALLAATLLFSTRPGALEPLLAWGPLSFLLPEYTLYAALLLISLCAAMGLDELLNPVLSKRVRAATMLLSLAICLYVLSAQLPVVAKILPRLTDCYFDAGLPMALVIASFSLIALFILPLAISERHKQLRLILLATLVAGNSLILGLLTPRELGVREPFDYRNNSITSLLQGLHGRMMATGYNLFQPNTNLVYGVDDFRSTAPLYPRRYAQFLRLGGGGGKFCTIPEIPTTLNHIFDLAAVKYVLSDHVLSSEPPAQIIRQLPDSKVSAQNALPDYLSIKLADGLRLDGAQAFFEPRHRELFGSATFTLHSPAAGHYSCAFTVLDADGKPLTPIRWLNDRIEEVGKNYGPHKYLLDFSLPVSNKLPAGTKLTATLFVRDNWTGHTLGAPSGISVNQFVLDSSAASAPGDDRFLRLAELPGGLYLYENRRALPQAYIVHNIQLAKNEEESLAKLSSPDIDWKTWAIIENASGKVPDPVPASSSRADLAKVLNNAADTTIVLTRTTGPAWLILADTYYPGWTAEVDGKPQTIYPANHMFRAVRIPTKGRHIVRFQYAPSSFTWGCNLFGIIVIFSALAMVIRLLIYKKGNANLSTAAVKTRNGSNKELDTVF